MNRIEKAAEAMWNAWRVRTCLDWPDLTPLQRDEYRAMARAALPHLSVIEEPTLEEKRWAVRWYHDQRELSISKLLDEFVRRRNAPPEPPQCFHVSIQADSSGHYSCNDCGEPLNVRVDFVGRHFYPVDKSSKPAAPPEPDPRREVMLKAVVEELKYAEYDCVEQLAARILSALDSLSMEKP